MSAGFELDRLGFAFDGRAVIEDMSLDLEPGRFYGVVVPNGCGKTTLVDLLCRFREPQHGRIRYGGRPLSAYSKRQLAREIALVPQNFYINFPFTVSEIVMMGRYPYISRFSGPTARDLQVVAEAMESADVAGMSGRFITELSGGERQRVVFARALAQQTPVLVLDEATSNLDIGHALRLLGLAARKVRAESATVVAVFQDISQAAAWCDRLVFMAAGRVAACGPTAEVLSPETIRSVFAVDCRVYRDDYSDALQVVYKKEGLEGSGFRVQGSGVEAP